MLFALFLLLAAPGTPPAAAPPVLAADAEGRWVPFELTSANQIRFTALVNGRRVVAILDTGVTTSAVSRRFANAAKLVMQPGGDALTVGGSVAAGWAEAASLAFGPVARGATRFAVADFATAATGGAPVDLLIGADLTAPFALDLDFDNRRFRLLRSGRLPFAGASSRLRIGTDWPFYVTEVSIGDDKIDRIVIDTGDGTALTLAQDAAARLPGLAPATSTLDYSIAGATVADLIMLPELHSGTTAIRDVEMRIESAGGFSTKTGMSGRIGSGLLRGYRVLLDPGAGRMVLAPGRTANTPAVRSTSGLQLEALPDRLRVLHVMRGGPAEAAGWHAGDTICAVDGMPVDARYAASARARWPIGAAGRSVDLSDCSGTSHPLVLRNFY
ncbi:retropepsin-like aspartic protease [Sphingomonas immobilis]|uniref:Aspartyl protease family protein n=1 Tax=Sphingomonas immobilis TaxID=3063997 RepID=A0ABT8ZTF1_9SPHN|nr:aspartyl protease family protein [Sphingomonas sp. CA1-15]MDO7840849.1 aspartyl protease family protein [Sphingomonas sp. CA1-15]